MYSLLLSDKMVTNLKQAEAQCPVIADKLVQLQQNPLINAAPTNISIMGDLYVNADKFCILFCVVEEEKTVEILNVVRTSLFQKVLSGRERVSALKKPQI